MAALPIPAFDVHQAMTACGINDVDLFDGDTAAARMALDMFNNSFHSCMDKTFDEVDQDFKSYSSLTIAQGQIRLSPGIRMRVKAFIQWTRDEVRLGLNPSNAPFPAQMRADFIRRYKTHLKFTRDQTTMADAAKPTKLEDPMKWSDWYPTLKNYLRLIPGRDGVPLSYVVICSNDQADPAIHADFIDDYVSMAPLIGVAYTIDSAQVHTFITNLIAGNSTAEAKVEPDAELNDGRRDFQNLRDHYEGIGVHAVDITKADNDLQTLFYAGEKPPHMWWEEFEKRLTRAFTSTYVKKEGRVVHSEDMKLRTLVSKIKANFLRPTKASIETELTAIPMVMTYSRALLLFRNEVSNVHPPQMNNRSTRRSINQVDSGRGRRGTGRDNGRGRGYRGGNS
eukprot:scaffold178764_cov38-Attheya_sp.AAC.1